MFRVKCTFFFDAYPYNHVLYHVGRKEWRIYTVGAVGSESTHPTPLTPSKRNMGKQETKIVRKRKLDENDSPPP